MNKSPVLLFMHCSFLVWHRQECAAGCTLVIFLFFSLAMSIRSEGSFDPERSTERVCETVLSFDPEASDSALSSTEYDPSNFSESGESHDPEYELECETNSQEISESSLHASALEETKKRVSEWLANAQAFGSGNKGEVACCKNAVAIGNIVKCVKNLMMKGIYTQYQRNRRAQLLKACWSAWIRRNHRSKTETYEMLVILNEKTVTRFSAERVEAGQKLKALQRDFENLVAFAQMNEKERLDLVSKLQESDADKEDLQRMLLDNVRELQHGALDLSSLPKILKELYSSRDMCQEELKQARDENRNISAQLKFLQSVLLHKCMFGRIHQLEAKSKLAQSINQRIEKEAVLQNDQMIAHAKQHSNDKQRSVYAFLVLILAFIFIILCMLMSMRRPTRMVGIM